MAASQDILMRVVKVTSEVLGLDPETIKPTDNFTFDLGAESSQSVELIAGFEEEFNIEMDQEAALAVATVQGAADFVAKYVNK